MLKLKKIQNLLKINKSWSKLIEIANFSSLGPKLFKVIQLLCKTVFKVFKQLSDYAKKNFNCNMFPFKIKLVLSRFTYLSQASGDCSCGIHFKSKLSPTISRSFTNIELKITVPIGVSSLTSVP